MGCQRVSVLCVKSPTGCCVWISVFLLLIFIQVSASLVYFGGVFAIFDNALISPFQICPKHGELYFYSVQGAESKININILEPAVILSLYVSVVLVAFALLSMVLAAYAKDKPALKCSMVCQAASGLLIVIGIIGFMILNHSCLIGGHMTLSFYVCVGVQVELALTTVLTYALGRRLTPKWK